MKDDTILVSVKVDRETVDFFTRLCKEQGLTRSEAIRRYMQYCVENKTLVFENELKIKKIK